SRRRGAELTVSGATPADRLLAPAAGVGTSERPLTEAEAREFVLSAFEHAPVDGRRVLVIIPDGTRTAPIPLLYRLLYEALGTRAERLDYLIALGTHQPMSEDAIARHVGMDASERARLTP